MDLKEFEKLLKYASIKKVRTFESQFHWFIDFGNPKYYSIPEFSEEELKLEEVKVLKEVKSQVNNRLKEAGELKDSNQIECDICGESFSPQGFPMHYRSCLKKQELEAERVELERKVAELKSKREIAIEAEVQDPGV